MSDYETKEELAKARLTDMLDACFANERLVRGYLEACGLPRSWRVPPLEDCRGRHWFVHRYKVVSHDEPITREVLDAESYACEEICPSRRYGEPVRANGHFFAVVDTNTDGNIFLSVYDEADEVTDPKVLRYFDGDDSEEG